MNKKTSLEDIGFLLDEFVLDSKAKTGEYFDPAQHLLEQPQSGLQDQTQDQLYWRDAFVNQFDPIKP